MESPRRRDISAFVIAVAVALLISALFDTWQQYAVRDATLSGEPLLHVVQEERVPARLDYIDGSTAVPATVSLVSQGKVLEQMRTGISGSSSGNRFGFDLRPFGSAYGFTIKARAHQGPFLLYDEQSVELAGAPARTAAARTFRRELWLHVSYDRLQYYVRVTFAHDDPFAGAFVAGGMPLGTFLAFTLPEVSGSAPVDLSAFAIPGSQSVVVTPRAVTVRLSGDSNLIGPESVPVGDEVRLTMRHGEFEAFEERPHPDTIHMLVDGYRIRQQSPLPAQRSANGYATWYPSTQTEESDIVATLEPALRPGLGKVRRDLAAMNRSGGLSAALRVVLGGAFNLAPALIAFFILAPAGGVDPARRRLISALLTAVVAYPLAYGVYRTLGALFASSSDGDSPVDAAVFGGASVLLAILWILILRYLPGRPDVRAAAVTMTAGLLAVLGAGMLQLWFSPYSPGSFAVGTVLSVAVLVIFLRPELLRHCVTETWRPAERWATGAGIVAIVSVALTVPIHTPTTALGVNLVDMVLTTEFGAGRLAAAAIIMPVLFTGLHFAADCASWKWQEKPYAIAALWAAYAVGTTPGVFTIPLALALGVFAFRWIALVGRERRAQVETIRAEVKQRKATRREDFATMREMMRTRATLADLEERISAGAMKPQEYEQSRAMLQDRLTELKREQGYSKEIRLSDIAFGFGADVDPWKNGLAAAIAGFAISLVLVAFGTPVLRSSVPLFSTVTGIVGIVAAHVAGAFLFGYFFAYVRGTMGVTKSLAFSAAALAATLPVSLLVASRATMISEAVSVVMFYGLIGAWFDVHGWRSVVGRSTLGEAFSLGGLGNFAAVGTFAVTALVTGVSGQLQQVVPLLFKAVEAQFKIGL